MSKDCLLSLTLHLSLWPPWRYWECWRTLFWLAALTLFTLNLEFPSLRDLGQGKLASSSYGSTLINGCQNLQSFFCENFYWVFVRFKLSSHKSTLSKKSTFQSYLVLDCQKNSGVHIFHPVIRKLYSSRVTFQTWYVLYSTISLIDLHLLVNN